jgi:outer membrane lipoprotein-sorting protein
MGGWSRRATLAGVLMWLGAAGADAQDRGLSVLQQVAARYERVDALCADFTQHLSVPLLEEERTGRGRLCQARPNLFAMRFSDPEGDAVVVDGESTWVYFPSLDAKQVFKGPVEASAGGRDFHREFLERPEEKYHVRYEAAEAVEGIATHRLRLVPKRPAGYTAAVLWIDIRAPLLRRIRIEEENQSVRTITLRDIDLEATPDPEMFSFSPPPGALVISP